MPKTIEESKESGLAPEPKNSSAQEIKDRKIFEDLLKRLKEHPSAAVFLRLGACYELGKGVLQNLNEAFEYYEKTVASDTMCASAWHNLGRFYEEGLNGIQDDKKAFDCFFKATTFKEKAAAFWISLGKCYLLGKGVTQDNSKAAEYFDKAIKLEPKNPEALSLVQKCNEIGRAALPKPSEPALTDEQKFEQLKSQVAEEPTADLLIDLGNCYLNGKGTLKNQDEAFQFYSRALSLDNNSGRAQNNLGLCCYNGYGIAKDYNQAVQYYLKAIAHEKGDTNGKAHNNLGVCYQQGRGVEQNWEKAFQYYLKATELYKDTTDCNAHLNLAVCYQSGQGVEQNWEKAFQYYLKATEIDPNSKAHHSLGICYSNTNMGCVQDFDKAFQCFIKSVEIAKDDPNCWHSLGINYLEGRGTSQSYDKAIECFIRVIELKPELWQAWCHLGDSYAKNIALKKSRVVAIHFFKQAEKLAPNAQNILIQLQQCYARGIGGTVDLVKAKTYGEKIKALQNPLLEIAEPTAFEKRSPALSSAPKLTAEQELEQLKSHLLKEPTADLLVKLGECNDHLQKHEKAFACYARAIALDTKNAHAYFKLGESYEYGKGVVQNRGFAFQRYLKATELDPNLAVAQNNLGLCYKNQVGCAQDFNKAFKCFTKAVQVDKGEPSGWNNLGLCHFFGEGTPQNYGEATLCFFHATELAPDRWQGWYNLGCVCVENVAQKSLALAGIYFLQKAEQLAPAEIGILKKLQKYYEVGIGAPADLVKAKTYADKIQAIQNAAARPDAVEKGVCTFPVGSPEIATPAASEKVAEKPASPPLIYSANLNSVVPRKATPEKQQQEDEIATLKRELAEAKKEIQEKDRELNVLKRKPDSDPEDSASAKEARKSPTLQ